MSGMNAPGAIAWHVAYTEPKAEEKVALALLRKGFVIFLPSRLEWVRRRGRRVLSSRRLFPRYLFAGAPRGAWRGAGSIDGLAGILAQDGRPLEVPAAAMERLLHEAVENCCGRPLPPA
ncbi:MAG TPA: transcription termination/antitermination NusG family protein, partial [Methylocella sp.]|nr:transcription termination/antitermination NusG family protein [Methylocella sp.]